MRIIKFFLCAVILLAFLPEAISAVCETEMPLSILDMMKDCSPDAEKYIIHDDEWHHFNEVEICVREQCADAVHLDLGIECKSSIQAIELRTWEDLDYGFDNGYDLKFSEKVAMLQSDHPVCYVNIEPESVSYPGHGVEGWRDMIQDNTYYLITGGQHHEDIWAELDQKDAFMESMIPIVFHVNLIMVDGNKIQEKHYSFEKNITVWPVIDTCELASPLSLPQYRCSIQRLSFYVTPIRLYCNTDYSFSAMDSEQHTEYGLLIVDANNQPFLYADKLPDTVKILIYNQENRKIVDIIYLLREGNKYNHPAADR